MNSKTCLRIARLVCCTFALIALADPRAPECYVTSIGSACCAPQELSWEMCEGVKCITLEVYCDTLLGTENAENGLTDMTLAPCLRHIVTRECTGEQPFAACIETAHDTETAVEGTRATGNECSSGGGEPD